MQAKKMKLKQGKEVVGDGCWLWCSCESVGGLRRPKFHFGGGPGSVLNCAVSIPPPPPSRYKYKRVHAGFVFVSIFQCFVYIHTYIQHELCESGDRFGGMYVLKELGRDKGLYKGGGGECSLSGYFILY